MTKTNNNLSWRVARLEESSKNTEEKLDQIMENHLPHINQSLTIFEGELKNLSTRITLGIGVNIVLLISGIIGVVLLVK